MILKFTPRMTLFNNLFKYDWKLKFCKESIIFGHANDGWWVKEHKNQLEICIRI